MNNGYQKSNGCGADKEGGKIFNTFFYPELQSKHVRPLAYNMFVNEIAFWEWMKTKPKTMTLQTMVNEFDTITFRNGYSANAPTMVVECLGITIGKAKPKWSDNWPGNVFIIKLGKIITRINC